MPTPESSKAATAEVVTKWLEDSAAIDLLYQFMQDVAGARRDQPAVLVSETRARWVAAETERDAAQRKLDTVTALLGIPSNSSEHGIAEAIHALTSERDEADDPPPFDPVAEGRRIGQHVVEGLATAVERLVQNLTEKPPQRRQ